MSGILLLFVAALWLIASYFLARFMARLLPPTGWRVVVGALLFLALLPLPLIDEIVGARQFEKLCKENSTIKVDRAKAAGRTVYLADTASVEVKGTWVPVWLKSWRYVDVKTGETVVSYNTLQASSGILGPASLGPLTFRGYCAPGGVVDPVKLFKELGVTQIQRSALEGKGQK